VDFEDAASAKAALVRNGVEILGRAIKVNMASGANVAGKNRFNSKQKNGGHLAQLPVSEKPDGCNTVFLGNLPFSIDEAQLRELFDPCGVITDVRWVSHTRRSTWPSYSVS
jgi:RNA recognition motif-containing protein